MFPILMQQFKLDRTAFKAQRLDNVQNNRSYWLSQPPSFRLAASWFLTCAAYGLEYSANHWLDKSVFSMRKMP